MTWLGTVIGRAYIKHIRRRLPRRTRTYNGVDVPSARLFDAILPWIDNSDKPTFEHVIVDSLKASVKTGDTVVIVGGGWGVTTVVAANLVGPDGQVITYEGSVEVIDSLRRTIEMNEVVDRVELRHAVVSHAVELWGEQGNPTTVPPGDLPDCDILELDCEGAEIDILRGLEIRPNTIIVETHANHGSPEQDVRDRLNSLSYEIVNRGVEEPEKGIFVLTAVRNCKRGRTGESD